MKDGGLILFHISFVCWMFFLEHRLVTTTLGSDLIFNRLPAYTIVIVIIINGLRNHTNIAQMRNSTRVLMSC